MTQIMLYTGNGASLTPIYEEGRRESDYIRLVADTGKGITDGDDIFTCADVLKTDVGNWADCDMPDEDATEADYQEQLRRYGAEV